MQEGYRPVAGRARALVVLLWICGALGVLGALLAVVQVVTFRDAATLENPETPLQIAVLFGIGCEALVYLFVYLATAVVWAMFAYRSCANAHALGAQGMECTPGWAAGWYFVPFANLIKPFQATKEMYQATDPTADPNNWRWRPVPAFFGWWWGAWIVSNILGGIIGRLSLSAHPSMLAFSSALEVIDGLLDVALCVLAVRVVRALAERQEQKARVAAFA
jgi:Domain of unknown function (DUF4328)